VYIANAPLHSLFSQINLSLEKQPVSQVGPNYPYNAYLDLLLDTENYQELYSQLFVKDTKGGSGAGLKEITKYLLNGETDDLIGGLKLDFCQQDLLILKGVPVNLTFWQTIQAFRLLGGDKLKLNIVDTSLEVAIAKISPGVLLGHADVLKDKPASYPYTRSVIKMFAIPTGQYSFTTDDLCQGQVHNQLILGILELAAFHGDSEKNPYTVISYNCNYVGFYVNGQFVPSHPLQPNYEANLFVEAFSTIKNSVVNIDIYPYLGNGYCLYVINPAGIYSKDRITPVVIHVWN
jgi:hypothetical protein